MSGVASRRTCTRNDACIPGGYPGTDESTGSDLRMTTGQVKVLLTGCKGQVGWEFCERAGDLDSVSVVATDLHNLDITDRDAIRSLIESEQIDLVVNAAAYTAVDKAETEEALARAVNVDGPENLSAESAVAGIPVFHISTDYVFDGKATHPYTEDERPTPESAYGRTKLDGEIAVAANNPKHITLRTSWVFGRVGGNFVKTMIRLAKEQDELRVVADQFGSPTFAGDLADVLLALTISASDGELPWGLYHYCGQGPTTWHGFATQIVGMGCELGVLDHSPVVTPIRTEEFETAAVRPGYSVLNCRLFEQTFPEVGLRAWRTGLTDVLNTMTRGDSST